MGYIRQTIHLLPDHWTAPGRAPSLTGRLATASELEPSSPPQSPVHSIWVCLLLSPHKAALLPTQPLPPWWASQFTVSFLSAVLRGGRGTTYSRWPQDPFRGTSWRGQYDPVSPRIWGTADLKIVHVHVTGMEELRVAEFLALRQKINVHYSPHLSKKNKNKKQKEAHFPPTILQSSRARWVLWALSEPLPLRSQSRLCSGGLLIWKIEERVDRLGRFLRPFGAELMHTHPPSRSRWCSAPRRGRPGSCPARRLQAAGAGTRGAALTGLGLAARVGNLQLEGEPGKRWLCRAASLPLAVRKELGQVLLSSTAGPVPGAGRWRGLALSSARHGSQGWARRNTPPGGS